MNMVVNTIAELAATPDQRVGATSLLTSLTDGTLIHNVYIHPAIYYSDGQRLTHKDVDTFTV